MTRAKILVVEDEAPVREQIVRYLSQEGFLLDQAPSGEIALEKASRTTFSVVLLDLRLPKMDGFSVLRQFRKEYPDTCVIILTAYGDTETITKARQAGAFDFFDKPIKYKLLVPSIQRAVEQFNLSREKDYQAEEAQQKFTLNTLMRALLHYDFYGNVRELENIIYRAIVLTDDNIIQPAAVAFDPITSHQAAITKYFDLPIREFSDACERDYLVHQLTKHQWHISNTAKAIGLDRSNLTLKMKKHGLSNDH